MAQSYFPTVKLAASPAQSPADVSEPSKSAEDVQDAYIEHRDKLVTAIDDTKSILGGLRDFNEQGWVIRYPQFREQSEPKEHQHGPPKRRSHVRRSLSFADEPDTETEVVFASPAKRMHRSMTLATVHDIPEETTEEPEETNDHQCLIPTSQSSDFHVLRLDLKLGPSGSSSSPATLVSQLEKSSIANLLDKRVAASADHMDKLRARILDTASKVLVTGDLNAGKSTFVNAVLRREVMPVDQQPCTTAFCEVHDAAENNGVEEVHLLKDGAEYSVADESTYTRANIADLENIVSENENTGLKLKVYLCDHRSASESLLNNGVVDISLIDAPGLNRDVIKTTEVFSRQEEIDVVVFVVSAENHFTLSAKDFLLNASHEKAYVFVVVNKFNGIRDKAKCRRLVMEQVKQLSPRTYQQADELVHFVDSAVAANDAEDPSFAKLQTSLRSFVLEKREQSKLAPATTYLSHLLRDIELLVGSNAIVASAEAERAKKDLDEARPVLNQLKKGRDVLEDSLETIEEEGANVASKRTKVVLADALECVAKGELGAASTALALPSYPGLLNVWDYVIDVRRTLLTSLDTAVKQAEDDARATTTKSIGIIDTLAKENLPSNVAESTRVFMPESMFSARVKNPKKLRRVSGGVGIAGVHGLGLNLAQRSELLEPTMADLFDANHQFWVHFGGEDDVEVSKSTDDEVGTTAIGVASVGLGALTMVGGKAMGMRGLVEGVLRVSDIFQNEKTRKWVAPILGACVIGVTGYYILELPHSIPRNVGRRIRRELLAAPAEEAENFVDAHASRVSRETRKVLRIAGWDLKERCRGALDEREREVRGAEEKERKSRLAIEYFRGVERRTGEVREAAGLVSVPL